MNSIEQEEIRIEREALKRRENLLNEREREIWKHQQDASMITADETLLLDDVMEGELNYIIGHSTGYVDGFKAAVNTIIEALSSEYRDITMTEDELYMLTELGKVEERAWLKDYKQKRIIEKAGWQFDFSKRSSMWHKKEEKTEDKTE